MSVLCQFCFIRKGDKQLSKRPGVIFLPAVSSSGSVSGASPERHVGESHPAPFLCRLPWLLSLGLWLWAGGGVLRPQCFWAEKGRAEESSQASVCVCGGTLGTRFMFVNNGLDLFTDQSDHSRLAP